jgi:hypothetical protein
LHFVPQVLGRLFLQEVELVVFADLEDLRCHSHAQRVRFAQIPIDHDSHHLIVLISGFVDIDIDISFGYLVGKWFGAGSWRQAASAGAGLLDSMTDRGGNRGTPT